MQCLDNDAVVRYLSGDLPAAQHGVAESHLDSCVQCMGRIVELTRFAEERAGIAVDRGKFIEAVTEKLDLNRLKPKRSRWLERYNIEPGRVIDRRYRIDSVLGEGGMGIVIKAIHLNLDQPVALKFMHPKVAKSRVQRSRFTREAKAAARMRSENVARVLDLGEVEGIGPFIVMEYLEGQDLLRYLKKHAPLPVGEAVELIRQAANGVSSAHALGIVHRDLKPGNMFLTEEADHRRTLKVLDFGVSKMVDGDSLSMTGTDVVIGSPIYMAPELFETARNASFASDVWAIGVILYRMLTGRSPFYASSLPELVAKIHLGEPTPLTHWRPEAPREVVQVVDHCLGRRPEERFATAGEFLNALAQLPAHICEDPHAPTVAVGHLSSREPRESSVGYSESRPSDALLPPGAQTTAQFRRRDVQPRRRPPSPWVYAVVGSVITAVLFLIVLLAVQAGGEPGVRDGHVDGDAAVEGVE